MKNLIKILILFVCLTLIVGCTKVALPEEKTGDIIDGKMTAPFDVTLSINGVPYLNNEIIFTAEVVAMMNLNDLQLEFKLPEGFILTAGNLDWSGDVKKNQHITRIISAKAIRTGEYVVSAGVVKYYGPKNQDADGDILYINVGEDSANVSHQKPIPKQPPMEYSVGRSKSSVDLVMSFDEKPLLNKEVELSLMIKQYLDRKSNLNTTIILPDNFVLISGDLDWNGELAPGEVVYNKIIVKAVKKGEGAISVKAGPIYPQGYIGIFPLLYVNSSKYSADVIGLWDRIERK